MSTPSTSNKKKTEKTYTRLCTFWSGSVVWTSPNTVLLKCIPFCYDIIPSNLLTLIHPGGSQRNGSIVPKPAAAWAFRSEPFAACSCSTRAQTAPFTASTAAGRSQKAGGPVTESHVLPSGGPERGQRFSMIYLKRSFSLTVISKGSSVCS